MDSHVEHFPVTLFAWVDCANDFVMLEGDLHISSHTFYNTKTRRYQWESHSNPSGLVGEGMILGDTYHGSGPSKTRPSRPGRASVLPGRDAFGAGIHWTLSFRVATRRPSPPFATPGPGVFADKRRSSALAPRLLNAALECNGRTEERQET